jgi:hypothetical protein
METITTSEDTITYDIDKNGDIHVCYHNGPETCQAITSEAAKKGSSFILPAYGIRERPSKMLSSEQLLLKKFFYCSHFLFALL